LPADGSTVFVTGCHRSGTSLLAALVHDLVAEDGAAPQDQFESVLENPLGFFETKRLVELNDQLLQQVGCQWNLAPLLAPSWDSPPLLDALLPLRASLASYGLSNRWVDKDPRLCLTYPAYIHILLKRVPLVASLREPMEVATSLYARNGLALEGGLALWYLYNHHLAAAIDHGDLLIGYEQLLAVGDEEDGALAIHRALAAFFERHGHQRPQLERWRQSIQRRLRPDLNRSATALSQRMAADLNPALRSTCERAMAAAFSADGGVSRFQEAFAALPRPVLVALQRHRLVPQSLPGFQPSALQEELEQRQQALEASQRSEGLLRARLAAIETSSSWRLTAPLRHWKDHWQRRRGS